MDGIDKSKLKEEAETETDGVCGGFKHCTDRTCDPNDDFCQECIDDYDEAMKESMRITYKGEI